MVIAVSAPTSRPPAARLTRCEEIRLSSMSITRIVWARCGASIPSSLSTDMQYAVSLNSGDR
jgi:hypothetical protein